MQRAVESCEALARARRFAPAARSCSSFSATSELLSLALPAARKPGLARASWPLVARCSAG
eukprot:4876729-Prymnesium_polylepis.1